MGTRFTVTWGILEKKEFQKINNHKDGRRSCLFFSSKEYTVAALPVLHFFAHLLGSIALNVQCIGSLVATRTLKAGDDSHAARDDLTDNIGKNNCVIAGVATCHKTDVVTTNVLEIQFCMN